MRMFRQGVFAALSWGLMVTLAGCGGEGGQASSSGGSSGALVLKRHTLTDPGSGGMNSHTVYAPRGWTVEGGAFWPTPALFRIHPSQNITVVAPDGRQVEVQPTFGAYDYLPSPMAQQQLGARRPPEKSVSNGKPVVYMPQSADDWRAWIRKHGVEAKYPGATNIRVDPVEIVPPLTQMLQQQIRSVTAQQEQMNQLAAQIGDQSRQWSDGAVYATRAEYDLDGQRYEQVWVWGHTVIGTDATVGREMLWSIEPSVSFRAPLGELTEQMPLLMMIANSVRMTREWAGMKANHLAKMQKIDHDAFVQRQVQHAQFSKEMRQIITQTGQTISGASDHAHTQFMQTIHEVSDYEMPDGSATVTLPIHYDHYFTDGETIVLTNNPNIPEVQGMQTMLPATGGGR